MAVTDLIADMVARRHRRRQHDDVMRFTVTAVIGMAMATPSLAQTVYDPNAAAAVQSARSAAHAAHAQAAAARHDQMVAREAEAAGDFQTAEAARRAARFHAHEARRAAHVAGYDRRVAGAESAADRRY